MRHVFIMLAAALLALSSTAFAETKEIIAEGTYNMGDGETPSVAESRALLKAKQIAMEQAGTYVESYSKVKNVTLTQDEIQVLASGLMEVEILDKKRTIIGDGINFWVKVKTKVNTDTMEEMARKVKEKSIVEDYKQIQEAYVKSQEENDKLKKQLSNVKNEENRLKIKKAIQEEELLFQAISWYEKAKKHYYNKEYEAAFESANMVIKIDPRYANGYNARGNIYVFKKRYDRAMKDYNEAIILDPEHYVAYTNRGDVYFILGEHDRAINDYSKALAINLNYALAYTHRGFVYNNIGIYQKAIDDCGAALKIDANNAEAYYCRGVAYSNSDNQDEAIVDLQQACKMGNVDGCKKVELKKDK